MRTVSSRLILLPLLLLGACSKGSADQDCGYGGKIVRSGERVPSLDGCNSCSCLDGLLACTERACAPMGEDGMSTPPDLTGPDLTGGDVIMCVAGTSVFPSFDKRCGGPADCDLGVHQIDCCGSHMAIGLSTGERARFEAAEGICRAQYPKCRCATRPTVAEDGKSELDGKIAVRCQAGACMSYVP